ncbi:hypothetical protein DMA11_18590 [Marinilabiliaceae bacterium JC017]|nr:hypothetical protein DMA11_18590 [Marinilabiliaceae bacterium JC017]
MRYAFYRSLIIYRYYYTRAILKYVWHTGDTAFFFRNVFFFLLNGHFYEEKGNSTVKITFSSWERRFLILNWPFL